MATLVLSSIGEQIGTSVMNNEVAGLIAEEIGLAAGYYLDKHIFSSEIKTPPAPTSVKNLATSNVIPNFYGTMLVDGYVIWASEINRVFQNSITEGSYQQQVNDVHNGSWLSFVSLAISIGRGVITDLISLRLDGQVVNLEDFSYRLYYGTKDQMPDPTILSIEGFTPAYRGLAYIVFEDFPISSYGNRVPKFSFEVVKYPKINSSLANLVTSVNISPNSGEFGYATKTFTKVNVDVTRAGELVEYGKKSELNLHNYKGKADILFSLDQLGYTLPNVKMVSVGVRWFADSNNIASCKLSPMTEFGHNITTDPDIWSVAGFDRRLADSLPEKDGLSILPGTTDDKSLIAFIEELKLRNYSVMLYPSVTILRNDSGTKNRNFFAASAEDIGQFFEDKYNAFILHYCNLLEGKIDAFVIGNKLQNLVSVSNQEGEYPGIIALVGLAEKVKTKLGRDVIVTYAANYSEYHSHDNVYNMDPLWSSDWIDVVGIEAYFPIVDKPRQILEVSISEIKEGWVSGEYYDYYYTDSDNKSGKVYYGSPEFAIKNISYWWANYHYNPDGKVSSWRPKSKKVWFTTCAFPSINGAASQPDKVVNSPLGILEYPVYSDLSQDFIEQKVAIIGTLDYFRGSSFVERIFIGDWDPRPFPYFPSFCEFWNDCSDWEEGYHINGKLNTCGVGEVLQEFISENCILNESDIIVDKIYDNLYGYLINKRRKIIEVIDDLCLLSSSELVYSGATVGLLKYSGRQPSNVIGEELIVAGRNIEPLVINRGDAVVSDVNLVYVDQSYEYGLGFSHVKRDEVLKTSNAYTVNFNIPAVLTGGQAFAVAWILLYKFQFEMNRYSFELPIGYVYLVKGDVINLSLGREQHCIRITKISIKNTSIEFEGVQYVSRIYKQTIPVGQFLWNNIPYIPFVAPNIGAATSLLILDLPCFYETSAQNGAIFVSSSKSNNWAGANILLFNENTGFYEQFLHVAVLSTFGIALNALDVGPIGIFDEFNQLTVMMNEGDLIGRDVLLSKYEYNLLMVGSEILQFSEAELVGDQKYVLKKLLRGRFGTEKALRSHKAGEVVVLLDSRCLRGYLGQNLIGSTLSYKAVSLGQKVSSVPHVDFTYNAVNLRPLSVAHLKGEKKLNGDWLLQWIRRARIDGEWRDYIDVPQDEKEEIYEIDILRFGERDVVNTYSVKDRCNFLYNVSAQKSDFGEVVEHFIAVVYKLSAIVGRGAGEEIELVANLERIM